MNHSPTKKLVLIVEGHGDQKCLPGLVTGFLQQHDVHHVVVAGEPLNAKSCGNLKRKDGIENFVRQAVQVRGADAVLVLLDADKECETRSRNGERSLGPWLLERAKAIAGHKPISVVVAHREYEAWLIAGWPEIHTMLKNRPAQFPNLKDDVISLKHSKACEQLSGYERLLENALGEPYVKTRHQALLTKGVSFSREMQDRSRSFRKLVKELAALVELLKP
ncbi:MAG: DUF4276 family protein [Myxococcota bacterium]